MCRRDHHLHWAVTNATGTDLWVFVAPSSRHGYARDNAFVDVSGGRVVLRKIQLPRRGLPEPVFSGALMLAPGASERGTVPLGEWLAPNARNLWGGRRPSRAVRIASVVLEVGFAERRARDHAHPAGSPEPFVVLPSFDDARQELVRSAALSWR